jgi:methionine biosynthesis protein MetW
MLSIEERYEKYWKSRVSINDIGEPGKAFFGDLAETIEFALNIKGRKHLDVGCGDGNLIDIAQEKVSAIYGCDISESAVRAAKIKGIIAICVDVNFGYLPYRNESFDSITCIEVIEHVLDPLNLFKELYRILNVQGELLVTTPNIRYFRHLSTLLFKGTFPFTTTDSHVWGGGHLHYFTRKDLTYLLQMAGFNKIQFFINYRQFTKSKKRKLANKLLGESIFGEWFCNGIIAKASKV